ncbi:hypothetical protein DX927_22665 [Bacillus swezeyi]|uniref:Uncharacterized protein n=1 Tax=Bacillus swezeyi TaxID=1925020 RepID=A0A5M8RIM8_9BACI|nr:hypothetical protein DX927_22665 [Bacillus swezeyi]
MKRQVFFSSNSPIQHNVKLPPPEVSLSPLQLPRIQVEKSHSFHSVFSLQPSERKRAGLHNEMIKLHLIITNLSKIKREASPAFYRLSLFFRD